MTDHLDILRVKRNDRSPGQNNKMNIRYEPPSADQETESDDTGAAAPPSDSDTSESESEISDYSDEDMDVESMFQDEHEEEPSTLAPRYEPIDLTHLTSMLANDANAHEFRYNHALYNLLSLLKQQGIPVKVGAAACVHGMDRKVPVLSPTHIYSIQRMDDYPIGIGELTVSGCAFPGHQKALVLYDCASDTIFRQIQNWGLDLGVQVMLV